MKIVVVSDTHEERAFNQLIHQEKADAYFHAGDSELSYFDSTMEQWIRVKGNNDLDVNYPEIRIVELAEEKILLAHGHLLSVYETPDVLKQKAKEVGATIVLFGHTHMAGANQLDDILFVNPGSYSRPRGLPLPSYAIISAFSDDYLVEWKSPTGELLFSREFKRE